MSIREIHRAELSAILREYLTAVDMPIDVLVGLQKIEEFFQAHPEYLSSPENARFLRQFSSKLFEEQYDALDRGFPSPWGTKQSPERVRRIEELDELARRILKGAHELKVPAEE